MCGICGVLRLNGEGKVAEPVLWRMSAAQAHRGPDDEGYHVEPGVGLGFCRLAILDLTPAGHQPMTNEDGTVWLIFNGEIYNFQEIIPALERAGHVFRSRSDSEVIIHAYEEWGVACLQRFNGMFAFAIWDRRKREIFIARDRLGVKPLYYWSDGDTFVFGSELKSLLAYPEMPRVINPLALRGYLTYEYIAGPTSIFAGIHKLPAGHYLHFALDGSAQGRQTETWHPIQYWNVQYQQEHRLRPLEDYAQELRSLLRAAVRRRMISDVPLGAFLSGGIDSSIIVALMSEASAERPRTFSIGFSEQSFNELDYASIVARHFDTDHHVEILRPDAQELLLAVADYLDEPFADASALPTYLVAQMAHKHVTVALSGDAGDELFAGYDWYRAQRFAGMTLDRLPDDLRRRICAAAGRIPPTGHKKGWRNILRRLLEGMSLPAEMQHIRWQIFSRQADLDELLVEPAPWYASDSDPEFIRLFAESGSGHPLDQQQYADIKRYLADDILWKVDRMSMAVSLEARGPFLDYTLVEFAAKLPPELRLNGMTGWSGASGKYLLKYAMRGIVPDEILHRPKLGFNMPYKTWLRHDLRALLCDALAPSRLHRQGIFQPQAVQRLIHEHLTGARDHAHRLWPLLMFQLWADRFLAAIPIPTLALPR
jgi:asparagine synthase (glutamine-hydrolysing)